MARIKHIEVAGKDGAKLKSFYSELFDWQITRKDISGYDYYDIEVGNEPTAGIRHEPEGKPEIVVYIEVADVEESLKKAESLGAGIRIPPTNYGDLKFALVEDPEGNPIGLTQEN